MLKPTDVEQKTFSTALRGYDLDEVDDFLDEVVATLRELYSKADESPSDGGDISTAVAPAPAVSETPAVDESAIGRALVAAQTAADQLLDDARSQAENIVDEAKSEAHDLVAEKEAKRAEAKAALDRIATKVTTVKSDLAALAEEVSVKVDEMESVVAEAELEDDSYSSARHVGDVGDSGGEDGDSAASYDEDTTDSESPPSFSDEDE